LELCPRSFFESAESPTLSALEDHFMTNKTLIASGIVIAAFGSLALSMPAQALTMRECSAKYHAARQAGTLGSMTWNEFRRAQCGHEAAAAPAEPPAAAPAPATAAAPAAPRHRTARTTTAIPTATGNVVFPNAIAPRYANLSAGRARLLTCRDQYMANKPNNANGGLRWIEKGGGFWSECNRHLKG
jgi:hypothetical protein